MKKKLLFLLCLVTFNSYSQSWQWATTGGGIFSDKATDIDIDTSGQLYVSGYYNVGQPASVTANFGSIIPPASWGKEGFAAKVSSSGNWMWVNGAIGGYDERVLGLCTDHVNGYVYATGCTWYDIQTFGSCGGTGLGTADEIFVGKFDLSGNCQWPITAGTDGDDHGYDLVTDKQGNIYLTGFMGDHYGSFGSPGIFGSITVPMTTDSTAYVTKISPSGVFQWVKTFEAIDGERDNRVAVDTSGNVYVTGGFWGTKQFGSQTVTSNGGVDIFVVKFDSNGNQLWVKTTGSTSDDRGNAITVDQFNEIYVTGEFRDKVIFGTDTINNYGGPGGRDIFVARMKTNGTWVWAKRAGSANGGDRGNGIVVNKQENIFVTGQFSDTAKFGGNITLINPAGLLQVFVAAIDTNGKWRWALQGGGSFDDRGNGITCDDSCNVFVSGYYLASASFGNLLLNSAGAKDAFVASISNACFYYCTSPPPIVTASDSVICPGEMTALQVNSGSSFTWSPAAGLSNTTIANPVASPTATTTYYVTVTDSCGSNTDSVTITVAPEPMASISGAAGTGTICAGSSATLNAMGGGTYSWNTGATTTPLIISPTITTNYSVIVTNAAGCKDTATGTINVLASPSATATASSSTISLGGQATLTGNTSTGTYNWSPSAGLSCTDCSDPTANPTVTTTYTLITTDVNGCSAIDTVTVNVINECGDNIFLPNAFSPNGDGENDVLQVNYGNINCIKTFELYIYNGWGLIVFSSQVGPTTGGEIIFWDGTYNGEPMNTAVFVYYLKASLITGKEINKHGNISLIK